MVRLPQKKMAMGHYLDGKISAICGTHTHVPTSDTQIMPNGTAYQTDAGMCGDYDSVIGFKKEISIPSFLNKIRGEKMRPADGVATVCGFVVDLDEKTGLAKNVDYLRVGGRLREHIPNL
jgi:calcineurin-like phosphoesterase